jgi:hypothetical protein
MNTITVKKILFSTAAVMSALALSIPAYSADRLIVEDGATNPMFTVNDAGAVYAASKFEIGIQGSAATFHAAKSGTPAAFVVERTDGVFAEFLSGKVNPLFAFKNGTRFDISEAPAGRIPGSSWPGIAPYLTVASGGNVGIGTSTPEYLIDTGGAYCDGSSWVDFSSRKGKDDIQDLSASAAFETLDGLTPVTFKYKKDLGKTEVGFIAEDVPELVATKDRNGLSSMDIVAVLTKVVKEQQATISELKDKMADLETDMQMKKDKDPMVSRLDLPIQ